MPIPNMGKCLQTHVWYTRAGLPCRLALLCRRGAAERKQKSDLDWIFANGPAVAEKPHGASIQALAECFGLTNLWGRNGEGITYYSNARGTLELATPYLKAGDKAGWLARCELLRANSSLPEL